MMAKVNLLGALVAVVYYVLVIFVFVARLLGKPRLEHALGYLLLALAVPLTYMLLTAPALQRPAIYYVQVGLLLAYLAVEALLDYILQIDFRHVRWMTIAYVTLFFAGSGGMLGVAMLAGRPWGLAAIALFLVMTVLSFVQRAITGM
jgi:hypothetical protein